MLPKCCQNLSAAPLMMLILINYHLQPKKGLSNEVIEDLGVRGSQCCRFQQINLSNNKYVLILTLGLKTLLESKKRFKTEKYPHFWLFSPCFSIPRQGKLPAREFPIKPPPPSEGRKWEILDICTFLENVDRVSEGFFKNPRFWHFREVWLS